MLTVAPSTESSSAPIVQVEKYCFVTMTLSPETLLVVLAIAMCSLLLLFSIAVVIVFHCCKVETLHNLPHAMLERTRHSVNWARHSVFSHSQCDDFEDDMCPETATYRQFLQPPPTAV